VEEPLPQDHSTGRRYRTSRKAAQTAAFLRGVRAALAIDAAEHAGSGPAVQGVTPNESPWPTGLPGSPVATAAR
jgi:hypothetical protein